MEKIVPDTAIKFGAGRYRQGVSILEECGGDVGAPVPMTAEVQEILQWLHNHGKGQSDHSAQLVDDLAHNVPNIVGMKDTSGDITQTSEFIRRTRDTDFKVFGGKDTLLYASLCHGAVGGVCTAANFMSELIIDVYNKYISGGLKGSLEAQFKLNPVRLSMDAAAFLWCRYRGDEHHPQTSFWCKWRTLRSGLRSGKGVQHRPQRYSGRPSGHDRQRAGSSRYFDL